MNISHDPGGNCGVKHLGGVAYFRSNGKDFILSFIKNFMKPVYNSRTGRMDPNKGQIAGLNTFYTFSGCVQDYGAKVTYAQALADYIKEHKLGMIAETRAMRNTIYPEGHLIKVFVWHPNKEALEKWYEANK